MKRFLYISLGLTALLALFSIGNAVAQQQPEDTEQVTVYRNGSSIQTQVLKEGRDPESGRPARVGSIILAYQEGTENSQKLAARQSVGARSSESLSLPNAERVQVAANKVADALTYLRSLPDVAYAEADLLTYAAFTPNDTFFSSQWNMARIKAPQAWDRTQGSTSVRIAILDCGIFEPGSSTYLAPDGQVGHPDLRENKVVDRKDFSGSQDADDFCDHGTHNAGTAAANTNNSRGVAGVGFNTKLVNAKVLGDTGVGSISMLIEGILWSANCTSSGSCSARRAEVINMSLGGDGSCPSSVQSAIDIAWSNGVVIVAAAGNSNNTDAHWPAICNNVIAVSATGPNNTKALYSSYGSWVDVAAPGGDASVGVCSTDFVGTYNLQQGTSMASAHVAGLAGLVFSTFSAPYTNATRDAVASRILTSANKAFLAGSVSGLIDAEAAVGPAGAAPSSGPITQGEPGTCGLTTAPRPALRGGLAGVVAAFSARPTVQPASIPDAVPAIRPPSTGDGGLKR